MTSKPHPPDLCVRCERRPISTQSASYGEELQNLCESCLSEEIEGRMSRAYREWGGQLETAMREAGSTLPEGASGEGFVRSLVEDMRRRQESPEWRAYLAPMRAAMMQFVGQLKAELPGGIEDPAFGPEMERRMRQWQAEHPEFGAEHPPN